MKRLILSLIFVLGLSSIALPQVIESFDTDLSTDTTVQMYVEGSPSRIDYSLNTTDFRQGTGSGQFKFVIGALHGWGSNGQIMKRVAFADIWDWSATDSLALWVKVLNPPVIPTQMVFRIHIADKPTASAVVEEYVFEHATILDAQSDWVELRIPLRILCTDGSQNPSDSGFVIFPASWGGAPGNFWNNQEFDRDKIIGFNLGAVTTGWNPNGNLDADSVAVRFDGFRRFGDRPVPAIVFNGLQFMTNLTTFAWGQSSVEVVTGAGPIANSNAVKWTQGNEWGNGFTGIGLNVSPTFNLKGAWPVDSVKFKLKCEAGVGALRVQFEGGGGKKGTVFTPYTDGQWHSYAFPLRDMVYQDNTTGFDSSAVNVAGLMAEASGIAGKVVWITDWWTGNPKFDVIAPAAPTGVAGFPGAFQNVVTWQDVPGESGEVYDVYYSKNHITDVTAPGVELVKMAVQENAQLIEHMLLAPNTDQSVTYYYAIICRDVAGNKSSVSVNSSAVVNTAKGRPTVSLTAPNGFVADGNLAEWSAINPFRMFLSDGTAHLVTNTIVTNDDDCSAKAYVAVDNQYLYIAFDVNDDIYVPSANSSSYLNDCPDLYIGLYNWRGMPHTGYRRGAEPDYHFRFAYNRVIIDGSAGTDSLIGLGANYSVTEKFPSGYVVECRISLADLALHGNDLTFVPKEGYRLPIDFALNDADATGSREGILTYSPYNEDQSWNNVSRWLYTWIGNLWEPVVGVNDNELSVDNYALTQNYPNPFNPSTTIKYVIEKQGFVSLKVYDMLGREVANLVNQEQGAGVYSIRFDASKLASGIYMYKLESGSFSKINKMMLVK
jgi:hypothetical protein